MNRLEEVSAHLSKSLRLIVHNLEKIAIIHLSMLHKAVVPELGRPRLSFLAGVVHVVLILNGQVDRTNLVSQSIAVLIVGIAQAQRHVNVDSLTNLSALRQVSYSFRESANDEFIEGDAE